jgi:hypothetical protein
LSKVRAISAELEGGTEPLYARVARIRRLLKVGECAELLCCSTRHVARPHVSGNADFKGPPGCLLAHRKPAKECEI